MKRDFSKWEALLAASLVKEFEGLRLEAYRCPAGVPTIGYGHTQGVTMGTRIDEEQANRFLTIDLESHQRKASKYVHVQVTRGQFIALLDFIFNLGVGAFASSTLLKKLNSGDARGASEEFPKWVNSNGKVLQGLVRRRKRERQIFNEVD